MCILHVQLKYMLYKHIVPRKYFISLKEDIYLNLYVFKTKHAISLQWINTSCGPDQKWDIGV